MEYMFSREIPNHHWYILNKYCIIQGYVVYFIPLIYMSISGMCVSWVSSIFPPTVLRRIFPIFQEYFIFQWQFCHLHLVWFPHPWCFNPKFYCSWLGMMYQYIVKFIILSLSWPYFLDLNFTRQTYISITFANSFFLVAYFQIHILFPHTSSYTEYFLCL